LSKDLIFFMKIQKLILSSVVFLLAACGGGGGSSSSSTPTPTPTPSGPTAAQNATVSTSAVVAVGM
jgi:hypothetical protein